MKSGCMPGATSLAMSSNRVAGASCVSGGASRYGATIALRLSVRHAAMIRSAQALITPVTPRGVEVFSESGSGGEYLLLQLDDSFAEQHLPPVNHRLQSAGNRQALRLAHEVRRLMLAAQVDRLALEQCALGFVDLTGSDIAKPQRSRPKALIEVLDQIAEHFHEPLTLEQLAATYGQNELRLLRDFT